jgi:hypothetical protein
MYFEKNDHPDRATRISRGKHCDVLRAVQENHAASAE